MATLTKDQILQASDLRFEPVAVPEWGENGATVNVKIMTGDERDELETKWQLMRDRRNFKGLRAYVVSKVVVDDSGKPLFAAGDIAALGKKASAPLSRIFDKACELNGLTDRDVEELAKNSEIGPPSDSGTS